MLRGRRGFQALRHLRFPARPDAGRAAAARHRGRPHGVQRGDGNAEGRGAAGLEGLGRGCDRRPSGSRSRSRIGATEFLGYEAEAAEAEIAGCSRERQEVKVAHRGRRGRDRRQPDAVLRRVRRPGRRRRRRSRGGKGALFRVTDTQKKLGDLFVHRHGRGRQLQDRRRRRNDRRSRSPLGHPRQPLGDASASTRRCARCSAPTSPRRARWSRRIGCASTSRTPSR